jgi:hypothetical protein
VPNFSWNASAAEAVLPENRPQEEVWLTIFVHGIMSVKHHISLSNIINFIKDEVEDTDYASTVMLMRQDPFFHQNQAMQEIGLKKIDPTNLSTGNASSALANVMNEIIQVNSTLPIENHFYTFGWPGLLSPSGRYAEAKKLFCCIASELKKFKKLHISPKIRLIGYSHGGNLCLNLAAVKQRENIMEHFTLDQLVLLGVPIQHDNDYLINDSIFKKVYHFYSLADRVQQLDLFSWGKFFSNRTFKERKNFKLPQKLTQVCLQMKRNIRTQNNLLYAEKFPLMNESSYLRNVDPGHTELWLFGWTPAFYRDYSPLYPLPIVALTPAIIQTIEDARTTLSIPDNMVTIDLRPQQETVILKNSYRKNVKSQLLPTGMLADLKKTALRVKPEQYTKSMYAEHIQMAREKKVDNPSKKENSLKSVTAKAPKDLRISSVAHAA